MPIPVIAKSTLDFLKSLSRNNNRDWFNNHKDQYLAAKANVEAFLDELITQMNRHDRLETPSGKKSLYRIYNDVRFATNKSPYAARFSGYFRRVKPHLRGGYYYWIKPGGSHIGCGFAYPNPNDLKRIRQDIEVNYDHWHSTLNTKRMKSTFGAMQGDRVKIAPRGFDKDHPGIDLLRYKQFWFEHHFSDDEVLAKDFVANLNRTFKVIRPFFDYMSEVLTTDLNGEAIV